MLPVQEQTVQDRMVALSSWITDVCNHTVRVDAIEPELEMAVCMFLAEDGSCAPDSLAVRRLLVQLV